MRSSASPASPGFAGLPGSGAYSASKAAAIAYLESLRVEQRGTGVAVLTVCPGYIATPMTEKNPYPMPFLLDADEAARRIVRAIERRKRFYVLPWQMAIVGRCCGFCRARSTTRCSRARRASRGDPDERRSGRQRRRGCARYSGIRRPTVTAQ